jgi:hypothetical protein
MNWLSVLKTAGKVLVVPWLVQKGGAWAAKKLAPKKAKKIVGHVCDALEGKHGDELQAQLHEALGKAPKLIERLGTTLGDQAATARERGKK